MPITRSKIQYMATAILTVVGLLVWVFTPSDVIAYYEATYAESAHGDPISGVIRSNATCQNWPGEECVTGSCAHCHDTFDPDICVSDVNGLMLFAPSNPDSQTDNFCFQCHCDPVSSKQYEMIDNKDYGSTFGGGTANSTNIKDAFNFGPPNRAANGMTGSSHNLIYVRNWAKSQDWGDWITGDTNPCVICHDPHLAQNNHDDPYPVPPTYKTAVRRPDAPSSSINRPANLWGDEANSDAGSEIFSEFTLKYQAPKRVGGGYEPDGLGEPVGGWGSNLPNFKAFCVTCHSGIIEAARSDSYVEGDLRKARYAAIQHGSAHHDCNFGDMRGSLKLPYNIEGRNYRLSCCDCHDPHGSPNPFLLRTCVNGKDNITVSIAPVASVVDWNWNNLNFYDFCTACHDVNIGTGDHDFQGAAWIDEDPTTPNCMFNGVCHGHKDGEF